MKLTQITRSELNQINIGEQVTSKLFPVVAYSDSVCIYNNNNVIPNTDNARKVMSYLNRFLGGQLLGLSKSYDARFEWVIAELSRVCLDSFSYMALSRFKNGNTLSLMFDFKNESEDGCLTGDMCGYIKYSEGEHPEKIEFTKPSGEVVLNYKDITFLPFVKLGIKSIDDIEDSKIRYDMHRFIADYCTCFEIFSKYNKAESIEVFKTLFKQKEKIA